MTNVPKQPGLARTLADLERRLRTLESAAPLRSASIGEGGIRVHSGGGIIVEDGGEITFTDPGSFLTFLNGGTLRVFYPDGTTKAVDIGDVAGGSGLITFDDNGTRILEAIGGRDSSVPNFRVYDRDNNVIISTMPPDSGKGLRFPVLSGHWSTEAGSTTNNSGDVFDVNVNSFQNSHVCEMDYMSSHVTIVGRLTRQASANDAEARVRVNDGNSEVTPNGGGIQDLGAELAGFRVWDIDLTSGATSDWGLYTRLRWRMQVRRTGGTGNVGLAAVSIQQGGG